MVVQKLVTFCGNKKSLKVSCDRAPCYTGQLSAQRLLREKLLLRVVLCNITFNLRKQGNVIHKAPANDLTAKRPGVTHFEIRNG